MTDAELDALVKRAEQARESDAPVYLIDLINSLSLALAAETARANRAEAERAAQIEAGPIAWVVPGDDHENCNGFIDAMAYEHGEFTRPLIAAQPHDRTALDAAIRATKVEAWEEAADAGRCGNGHICPDGPHGGCCAEWVVPHETILALIEREGV